jgi:hypothetical protein
MSKSSALAVKAIATLCFVLAPLASGTAAEQAQRVSYKTSAENAKYAQQLNVEAGDVPNHIVRVFDLRRIHPASTAPVVNGLKIVEEWVRGTTDIIDGNGSSAVYGVYVMENGDKFFARIAQVNQSKSGKITAVGSGPITGGTGKLAEIHGSVQYIVNFDVKSGFNEGQTDIEYAIGK